jgi:hypothetical protein
MSESTHVSLVSTHPDLNLDFHIKEPEPIPLTRYDSSSKEHDRLEGKPIKNKRLSAYISRVF